MPHIGVLMERSLQDRSFKDAFVQLVERSTVAAIGKRQSISGISDSISDAKTAFSSWDNCMKASFCKWPVIAVIIIGGLILISIIWCIVRCACCGMSCCCQCCYCLKCCGDCCGCCDPPRNKNHKYLDEPYIPPNHNHAYRSEPPMVPSLSTKHDVPQYAEFDTGNKKDADSLPAMPSWEEANSKKVYIEEEVVEMEPLKKPDPSQGNLTSTIGLSHPTTPSPVSPDNRSPYGPPPGQAGADGYMAANHVGADPYGTNGQQSYGYNSYDNNTAYEQVSQNSMNQGHGMAGGMAGTAAGSMGRRTPHQDYHGGYRQASQDNMSQGYGMAGGSVGRQTPHQDYNNSGYEQPYPQSRTPRPYDEYGRSVTPGSYGAGPRAPPSNNAYASPTRMGSPGPQAGGYGYSSNANPSRMRSPGPQMGFEYPQRSQTTTSSNYTRTYSPAPTRQYSGDSARPLARPPPERQYSAAMAAIPAPPVSPIQNNSGFDFSSGYSRPSGESPPTPPAAANGGSAYPGYRAYKPQQ
ncbi:hypothetical protein F5X99DRAFT_428165 [Biscogniauxia marginata]|nr:hypothetical protein F5X99DRAFT_428165 [Biscogniauxia marginata]